MRSSQLLKIAIINIMAAPLRYCVELYAVGEFHGFPYKELPILSLTPSAAPFFMTIRVWR